MAALTAVAVFPVTRLWAAVTVEPYATVRPYWNVTVVDEPLALTLPFNVAPELVIAVAALVVAVGGVAAPMILTVKSQQFP